MRNNLITKRGNFTSSVFIGLAWILAFVDFVICRGTAAMLTAVAIILLAIGTVDAICTTIEQHRHEDNGPIYR